MVEHRTEEVRINTGSKTVNAGNAANAGGVKFLRTQAQARRFVCSEVDKNPATTKRDNRRRGRTGALFLAHTESKETHNQRTWARSHTAVTFILLVVAPLPESLPEVVCAMRCSRRCLERVN